MKGRGRPQPPFFLYTCCMIRFPSRLASCAVLLGFGMLCAPSAWATLWKCTDGDGRITYTNDRASTKGMRCEALRDLPYLDATPAPSAPAAASPSNFPRVSPGEQRQRDDLRRRILEEEKAAENQRLQETQRALQTASPERAAELKAQAERQRRNLEAIERELQRLR